MYVRISKLHYAKKWCNRVGFNIDTFKIAIRLFTSRYTLLTLTKYIDTRIVGAKIRLKKSLIGCWQVFHPTWLIDHRSM